MYFVWFPFIAKVFVFETKRKLTICAIIYFPVLFRVVFLVPLDVVVADAIVKNVPNFDLKLAKEALIKDVSYFTCLRFPAAKIRCRST